MESSSAGARVFTAILVAIAAWAAVTAVAVYSGLGGRADLHPDDPTAQIDASQLDLAATTQRLDAFETYTEVVGRPLFNPDRRPLPVATDDTTAVAAEPPPAPPLDVTLTSVILTRDVNIAMVMDNKTRKAQSIRIGANLEGDQSAWRLAKLESRKAVFEGPSGETAVELRVFDGSGGQSPTPMAAGVGAPPVAVPPGDAAAAADAESRAEMIRRRIEERRRQMREEAARAEQQAQQGQQ